jgi:hypothetical protein
MRNSLIDIQPIAGALGAEVGGVDVAEDLDDAVISEIRQALLDYGVIFFRDQTLDVARAKAFTRRFGAIFIHPNYKGVSADPEIVDMVAGPQAGMNAQRSTKVREDADWRETISVHPVVRTHPGTGRKLLFVNRSYTVGFAGRRLRASRCWTICWNKGIDRNSPAVFDGRTARSRFGITAAPSIWRSMMPGRFAGSCGVHKFAVTPFADHPSSPAEGALPSWLGSDSV